MEKKAKKEKKPKKRGRKPKNKKAENEQVKKKKKNALFFELGLFKKNQTHHILNFHWLYCYGRWEVCFTS